MAVAGRDPEHCAIMLALTTPGSAWRAITVSADCHFGYLVVLLPELFTPILTCAYSPLARQVQLG